MTTSSQSRIEFGTDGIRGIAGQYPLDPATVLHIGQAIGRFLTEQSNSGNRSVLIGRDTRVSGHMLAHSLAAGLLGQGVDVIYREVVSTPGVAFLVPLPV